MGVTTKISKRLSGRAMKLRFKHKVY